MAQDGHEYREGRDGHTLYTVKSVDFIWPGTLFIEAIC